ncbi:MAG: ATP phosphoribosyltransferase regulatory subunit [Erysipelotrichaceae bacterium]|nr:ATP phosphoribosyltransferase regulatory subunit [Erysipelotrichaceae bacterium]
MEIRTPQGTRDLTGMDVLKKRKLEQKVQDVFRNYCFEEVMTPAFEYYQTYNAAFSSLEDRAMVKFFDEMGDILTLRMDMTVPIARMAAQQFQNADLPLRFFYNSNVYKVKKSFAGKRNEITDTGVELIGLKETGDLEILCCALDTLRALDMDHYTLELGDVTFFSTAAAKVFKNPEDMEKAADLIDRKSMVELEAFLKSKKLPVPVYDFFMELPLLSGGPEVLDRGRALSFDYELAAIIDRMKALYAGLRELGYAEAVSFDLGALPHIHYYTGLIFAGFVKGVGTSVLSGGRYDRLLGKFGRDLPAVGFSVKLDYLLEQVKAPEKPHRIRIFFPEERAVEAYAAAREARMQGPVEMVIWDREEIVEENCI